MNDGIIPMKELKKIAPALSKIKKENIYRVPEDYFKQFPVKMMERIGKQGERQRTGHAFRRFFKPQLAIAAAILAFAILGYLSVRYLFSDGANAELSPQEIAEYFEYYSSELDEGLYYEVLDEMEVDEPDDREYDEIIIDYLLDQGIDYQLIMENL
jgi:hypothetical protein